MDAHNQALSGLHQTTMAALRAEHPEWTDEVFGDYETRFAELLRQLICRPRHQQLKIVVRRA